MKLFNLSNSRTSNVSEKKVLSSVELLSIRGGGGGGKTPPPPPEE